jgi:hypothetical protein
MSEVDWMGAEGGRLATAAASGWVACFVFCLGIGRLLWAVLGKAKDDQIAQLKTDMAADRLQCAEMETRMVARIQQLEGFILAMSPGHLRQQIQSAISEQRVADEAAHRETDHEAG